MATTTEFEYRDRSAGAFELREQANGMLRLTGYASVTDAWYDVAGIFEEQIAGGAFRAALAAKPKVVLNVNHAGLPLASTKTDTLHLSEDSTGFAVNADLDPDDHDTQTVARKVRSGLVDSMSFAFVPLDVEWNRDMTRRRVTALDLDGGDVTVCVAGANPLTTVSMRSAQMARDAALAGRSPAGVSAPRTKQSVHERFALLRAGSARW